MANYVLVVMTNPTPGNDAEYNRWYDEVHLPDVCNVPGFNSARRFRLADGEGAFKYLAVYEVQTGDIKACLADLGSRAGTDRMTMSPALDMQNISMQVFEQISQYPK
ncbi:MAG: hypothetical protein AB7Q97_22355 [Gammaproteobacteria bacterium]